MKKIGIIGYNEGNGHPYSFAAIINGYDQELMNRSPYPGIANYLSSRSKEEFGIDDLKVTHVWTPYKDVSESIAECSLIENVSADYKDMIGNVDAVIIARDDVDSHFGIASFFLEKNIPVFVDKPLCKKVEELKYFQKYLENGLLMSCSGFRYFPLIMNKFNSELNTQNVVWSHSVSIIDWYKYGIHVLEGVLPIMGYDIEWVQNTGEENNDIVRVQHASGKFSLINVNTKTGFIFRSSFFTDTNKHFVVDYNDNFSCFRNLLIKFAEQLASKKPVINASETSVIIKTMIAGELSLKNSGKKIYLNEIN